MKSALTFAALLSASLPLTPPAARAESKADAVTTGPAPAPRSLFVIDPATSKDPFFPKSTRWVVVTKTNEPTAVVIQQFFPDEIRCQGFSGTAEKRLAIVNNKTVEKGDEFELTLKTGQRVRVHCIEVKEKGVLLEINGITRELGLRPNLQ
jgi:hypothetical protein